MVNLAVVAILSFTIPIIQEASWLGRGFMQSNYHGAYTLKASSSFFSHKTKSRFITWSLKKVSYCPNDHSCEGNMGA